MLAFLLTVALAQNPAQQADTARDSFELGGAAASSEAERLEREMEFLALKERWDGVEDLFTRLLRTREAPSPVAWRLAYEAARVRGDVSLALYRIERAELAGDDSDTVRETIANFRRLYGRVSLLCDPGSKSSLQMVELPFAPELRRAVEFAGTRIERVCEFEGVLPAGEYRFANSDLRINPGVQSIYVNRRTLDGERLVKAKERSERKWLRAADKARAKAARDAGK